MARRVSTDSHGYGRRRDLSTQTSQHKQDRVSRGNKESSADADTQTDPPQERPCGGRWQTLLKTETTRASHRDRSAIPPHAQSAPRAGARPAPHSSCPPGTLVCRAQSGCQNGTTTTSPTLTWLRNPELQHTPWHSATTQQAALATAGGYRTTASGQQAMPSGRTRRQLSGPRRPGRGLGLQSRPLPSAPLASPENAILQENVGQEPTPTRVSWPSTHNHADLHSPPRAGDGPAENPQQPGAEPPHT